MAIATSILTKSVEERAKEAAISKSSGLTRHGSIDYLQKHLNKLRNARTKI